MTDPDKRRPAPSPPPGRESKEPRKDHRYDKQVEGTFPASDPPAESEPGGGITGPTPTRERHEGR